MKIFVAVAVMYAFSALAGAHVGHQLGQQVQTLLWEVSDALEGELP